MEEAKEKTKPEVLGAPLKRAKRAVEASTLTLGPNPGP